MGGLASMVISMPFVCLPFFVLFPSTLRTGGGRWGRLNYSVT